MRAHWVSSSWCRSTCRRFAAPTAARRAGSSSRPASASASASGVVDDPLVRRPTISWLVPETVVTTGRPQAIASRYASPNCSDHFQVERGAVTKTAAPQHPGHPPAVAGAQVGPRRRAAPGAPGRQRPVAEHPQPGLRHPPPDQRERVQHPVDALVGGQRRHEREHRLGDRLRRRPEQPRVGAGVHDPDPVLLDAEHPQWSAAACTRQRNRSAPASARRSARAVRRQPVERLPGSFSQVSTAWRSPCRRA